jgi:NADH:ubiquinone oxidoreductase subunit 6 (subunit J)
MLVAIFIIKGLLRTASIIYFTECVYNLIFLLIQLLLLSAYYFLRGKSIKSVLNISIGLGDIILLFILVFAFSKVNFVVFYLTGMIFSLIVWLAIQQFSSQKKDPVPLAGLISFYMILIVFVDIFYGQFERLSDNYLIHLLYG